MYRNFREIFIAKKNEVRIFYPHHNINTEVLIII
jgi:hypothetical protein